MGHVLSSVWSIRSIWLIWFGYWVSLNQINKTNQTDQPTDLDQPGFSYNPFEGGCTASLVLLTERKRAIVLHAGRDLGVGNLIRPRLAPNEH